MKKKIFLFLIILFIISSFSIFFMDVSAKENNIINAPYIKQIPNWPTGCEAVTAVMALKFWGFEITVKGFVDNHLSKGPYPYCNTKNVRIGSNPWMCFPGNPAGRGYGCYSPVIRRAVNSYLKNTKYKAAMLRGYSLSQLCYKYIDKNIPVILWATSKTSDYKREALIASYPGSSWLDYRTGKLITWTSYEHCMLLVGYDKNYYYFNDPLRGKKVRYTKKSTESAYKSLLSQAVVVIRK